MEAPFTELHARRLGPIRRFFVLHPVAMDWLLVAWFGLPALAAAFFVSPWLPYVLVILAGGATLLMRRSRPLLCVIILTALTALSIGLGYSTSGFEFALAFGLYAMATLRPTRLAWLTLIGVNAACAAALFLWSRPDPATADTAPLTALQNAVVGSIVVAGCTLVGLAIGASVRSRRDHLQRLLDRANQLALERDQRELLAAAAERARIAREMHDVVAHSLSVMIALADGAGASLTRAPDRSAEALRELSGTGRAALADMRRILGVLREDPAYRTASAPTPGTGEASGAVGTGGAGTSGAGTNGAGTGGTVGTTGAADAIHRDAESDPGTAALPMAPQPGAPALGDLVARFRATGLPVHLTFTGPPLPDDAGLQLTVYRIVQEGLTNVLRHAPGASYISVTIARRDNAVTVSVRNDAGGGPSGPAGSGKGLVGMRERAAVYDGTIEAGPDAGGWRLRAVLHFERKDDE